MAFRNIGRASSHKVSGIKEKITIFDQKYEIEAFRGIPYATAERFKPAKEVIENKHSSFDRTPHFPQPDEFNKSNWKSLPRIIKESQVEPKISF